MCHLDWLTRHRDKLQRDLTSYRAVEVRWSWIRLIVFVAGVALVIGLWDHRPLAATVGVAALAVFTGAVQRHAHWEDRRTFAEWVSTVVGESLHASTRRDRPPRFWQRPEDPAGTSSPLPAVTESGPTWPLTEQERDDLDVYGPPVGLFGLLNRTSTPLGARRLRDILDAPCLSGEHIRRRHQAVRWLGTHDEYRLDLMASLVPLRAHSQPLDTMVRLLHTTPHLPRSIMFTAVRLWSAVSGLVFVYAVLRIAFGHYVWGRFLILLLLANLLILRFLRPALGRLTAAVTPWADLPTTLSRVLAVAEHADAELPETMPLGLLKSHLHKVVADARIPSLCPWLEWAGLHGMARGLLNVVVFIDLHIAVAVWSRLAPNRDVLLHGLSALAELETLCSLACFSAELPVGCYPQPTGETGLSIQEGRHPLLVEQEVTPNSVHLASDRRTWVITGPNAAGKSTFLRMVGVNVLLAQTGAAVAASAMTWSPVRLITDVRIRDDLARHESYFLSEVRRLRRLVLDRNGEAPILGLIDEPFRGTNSQERIAAGIALLEHLMASRHLFLVATHEETLAQVAAMTSSAENCHFQEHLHDGGIVFDYRLRPGPATTRTALRILEREGYPNSLLQRARKLMGDKAS